MVSTQLGPTDPILLDYTLAYKDYPLEPAGIYFLKCVRWKDAAGHVDIFHFDKGKEHLNDYNQLDRGKGREFYLWVFTTIKAPSAPITEKTPKGDAQVYIFEHDYIPKDSLPKNKI